MKFFSRIYKLKFFVFIFFDTKKDDKSLQFISSFLGSYINNMYFCTPFSESLEE